MARGKFAEGGSGLAVGFGPGGGGPPERPRQAFKGGTVVFSSRSETADDVIRDLSRGAPAGTVVVTSDRGLRGTLRPRDVAGGSCEEFGDRLAGPRGEGGKGPVDEEGDEGRRKRKKGEGQKQKKRDRERGRSLRRHW